MNELSFLFSLGLPEKQSITPKLQTSAPNMISPLSTSIKECPDVKVSNFAMFSQTLNSPQFSNVKPTATELSSKPVPTINSTQPFASPQFSLAQTVPQKHTHPSYPSISHQRLPQPDVMQGGTQLMFPSHFQDGRATLRFRYLNLLARLFPQFSDIFINSVLEDTNCDLLAAAEWLVQLEDRRSFMYPAFETFGTIPFANQYCEGPDVTHQKAIMETQQLDARPSIRYSPSNIYIKHGRDANPQYTKGNSDMQQSQPRLSCTSQACVGPSQTDNSCLYAPSQPFQNKTAIVNRASNTLPNSQVGIFITNIRYR